VHKRHRVHRTMGVVFVVLGILLLLWHLAFYWAMHPDLSWRDVMQVKRKRMYGGVMLLAWGALPWIVPRIETRKSYTIRRRGRQF
jgi:hypothetical protein